MIYRLAVGIGEMLRRDLCRADGIFEFQNAEAVGRGEMLRRDLCRSDGVFEFQSAEEVEKNRLSEDPFLPFAFAAAEFASAPRGKARYSMCCSCGTPFIPYG